MSPRADVVLTVIPATRVAPRVRSAAQMGVAESCRRLGLRRPRVSWFVAPAHLLGCAWGGEVFLLATQSARSAFETAAHEVRHLLQGGGQAPRPATAAARALVERDAEAFAMRLRRSGLYDAIAIREEG